MKKILFVCTGNTCRSPMAEALMRHIAKEENIEVEVRSAGVCAAGGSLASNQAIEVLKEKGIDYQHRSQTLGPELVEWADLILTMTSHHKLAVLHDFPRSADKVYTLKEYANLDQKLVEWRRELDRLYVEMESKRAEIQSRFSLKADEPWPKEAEDAWKEEMEPLLQREKELLKRLESDWSSMDIRDPFGGSVEIYRKCADELEQEIRKILKKWRNES